LPWFGKLCEHLHTVNTFYGAAVNRVLRQELIVNNLEARLLTVSEAAKYLSTTPRYMRTLAWRKELPTVRLGKRLLFDKQDLDAFIAEKKCAA